MFNLMREYHKKFIILKNFTPRTENNKKLKQEVLINAGDLYNLLYYIYKNKYNKKINSLDTKNKTKLHYKKLRLTDDYQYLSEEETQKEEQKEEQEEEQEEKQKETITDANKFNKWVNKQETEINTELFKKYFKIQRPSDMLKYLYQTNDRKKNNELVNVIHSGLKDLKKKLKRCLKKK